MAAGSTASINPATLPPGRERRWTVVQSLVDSLDQLLSIPYEIVDHQTAVRPILVAKFHVPLPEWGGMGGTKGMTTVPEGPAPSGDGAATGVIRPKMSS